MSDFTRWNSLRPAAFALMLSAFAASLCLTCSTYDESLLPFLFPFFSALNAMAETSPAPVKVPGFAFVRTVGPISEYRLESNGLQVLLMPEHSSPTLTFMVTYRVGSRNEVIGTTGATHLLEHLMFKGSPKFNDEKGNSVKQFLERVGGVYNASTWNDRTNYYANIASENLEGYMAIEADRMRNLWLRESRPQTGDDGGAK